MYHRFMETCESDIIDAFHGMRDTYQEFGFFSAPDSYAKYLNVLTSSIDEFNTTTAAAHNNNNNDKQSRNKSHHRNNQPKKPVIPAVFLAGDVPRPGIIEHSKKSTS